MSLEVGTWADSGRVTVLSMAQLPMATQRDAFWDLRRASFP